MTDFTSPPRRPDAGATSADMPVLPPRPRRAVRISRLTLHAVAAALPLATSNFSWLPGVDLPLTYDEFDTVKFALLLALTAVAGGAWAWSTLDTGGRVRWSPVGWLVLVFLVWACLSTVFSVHPETALLGKYRRYDGVASFIAYATLLFVALQVVDTPERRRALARTICLAGAVVAMYGVAQYLGFDPIERGALPFEANRSFSTMGNPDLLGGYLIFPLVLSAALALSERDRRRQAGYWVCLLVVAGAWLTAFSRGPWIGGGMALLLLAAAYLKSGLRPNRVDLGFALATAVGGGTVVARSLSSSNQVTNVFSRLRSIFEFGEGSARTRFEIWQAALRSIEDRPILGHGPDTFRLVFRRFAPREYVRDAGYNNVADNAHNYALQAASGLGVPGALLLYGIFGWTLWRALPAALDRGEARGSLLVAGYWAATAGYVTYLFFGLSVTGSSALLWLLLGVLLVPSATRRSLSVPGAWRLGRYLVPVGVAAVVALALLVLVADHYRLESAAAPTTARALAAAERATRLNPLNGAYRSLPGDVQVEIANEWFAKAAAEARAGMDPGRSLRAAHDSALEAIATYRAVIDFMPTEADTYVNLVVAQRLAAEAEPQYLEDAVATARAGLEVHPHGPVLRVQAALALAGLGRVDEAVTLAEEATALDPRYADALLVLGGLYADSGRIEEALTAYQAALALDPGDPTLTEIIRSLETSLAAGG